MDQTAPKKHRTPEHDDKPPLTTKEAAAMLGIQPGTLEQLRKRKKGPPFLKAPGIGIRYLRQDLVAYLARARRPNLPPLPPPSDER